MEREAGALHAGADDDDVCCRDRAQVDFPSDNVARFSAAREWKMTLPSAG